MKRQFLVDILEKELKAAYIGKEYQGRYILDVRVQILRQEEYSYTREDEPSFYDGIFIEFEVQNNLVRGSYWVEVNLED